MSTGNNFHNVKIQYMDCSTRMWVSKHVNYRNSNSLMDVSCPFRSGSCLLINISRINISSTERKQ